MLRYSDTPSAPHTALAGVTLFALAALSATPSLAAYYPTQGSTGYMPYVAGIGATVDMVRIQGAGSLAGTEHTDPDVSYARSYTWTQDDPNEMQSAPAFQVTAQVSFDSTSVGVDYSGGSSAGVALAGSIQNTADSSLVGVASATADTALPGSPTNIYAHSDVITMTIPAGTYAATSEISVGMTNNVSAHSYVNVAYFNGYAYANQGRVVIGSPYITIAP